MITISREKTKNINKVQTVVTRRQPIRTCVACRQVKPKREMVRIVRTAGGDIEFDTTGKKEGRGAYFCPTRECLEKTMQGKQLEHVLKCRMTPANRERLIQDSWEILKENIGKGQ